MRLFNRDLSRSSMAAEGFNILSWIAALGIVFVDPPRLRAPFLIAYLVSLIGARFFGWQEIKAFLNGETNVRKRIQDVCDDYDLQDFTPRQKKIAFWWYVLFTVLDVVIVIAVFHLRFLYRLLCLMISLMFILLAKILKHDK